MNIVNLIRKIINTKNKFLKIIKVFLSVFIYEKLLLNEENNI